MKTIQTKPDCTLGFLFDPDKLILNMWKFNKKDPKDMRYNNIGRLSEITEEQAVDLVEEEGVNYSFKKYPFKSNEPVLYPFHYSGESQEISYVTATHSLYSAALSVGIEEKDFDKYLIIKL